MTHKRMWLTGAAVAGVGASALAAGLLWLVWFVLTDPVAFADTLGRIR